MSDPTAAGVCAACRAGKHPHDRFTDTGADAGCPNFLAVTGVCRCTVVVHPVPPKRCPTCGRAA